MNSRDPLTVALDIGTGSVRAHLMDCSGGIVKTAGRPVQVLVGADGRAEVDPEKIWKSVCQCVPEILAGTLPSRIAAVGLASALGYLLLDGKGNPITPALLWMDRRASAEAARRIAPVERVFEPNPLNRAFYDHLLGLRRILYEGIRGPFQSLDEFRIRTQEREMENRDLK